MTDKNTDSAAQSSSAQGQFNLQRIYIKDLSFEVPGAPAVFRSEWKPEVQLELNNHAEKVEDGIYEVVLTLNVTVKNQEKTAFIVELKQAGIFLVKGFDQKQLPVLLGSYCPSVLYPYAREAVSDVVGKGSFPQLLLAPVNFEALFAESVKNQQTQAANSEN
ncbi:MAG: protein-export chaperone SecB [Gammaproteobacteria bacterium]